jgi:hypothetical protein
MPGNQKSLPSVVEELDLPTSTGVSKVTPCRVWTVTTQVTFRPAAAASTRRRSDDAQNATPQRSRISLQYNGPLACLAMTEVPLLPAGPVV